MTDQPARLILVTGATGAQGGALVPLLLQKGFRVRALTRNPDKPAGRQLAAAGCEVVAGDLDDEASLERACAGAWGVAFPEKFVAGSERSGWGGFMEEGGGDGGISAGGGTRAGCDRNGAWRGDRLGRPDW